MSAKGKEQRERHAVDIDLVEPRKVVVTLGKVKATATFKTGHRATLMLWEVMNMPELCWQFDVAGDIIEKKWTGNVKGVIREMEYREFEAWKRTNKGK